MPGAVDFPSLTGNNQGMFPAPAASDPGAGNTKNVPAWIVGDAPHPPCEIGIPAGTSTQNPQGLLPSVPWGF